MRIRLLGLMCVALITIFIGCLGNAFDPCEDVASWSFEDGDGTARTAWMRAMGMWGRGGVKFADSETTDGLYRVHVIPGFFRDSPLAGLAKKHWDPIGGSRFTIYVDPEKLDSDYTAMAAVMAHEIGHTLGFDHIPLEGIPGGRNSVMNTGRRFGNMTDIPEADLQMYEDMCRN